MSTHRPAGDGPTADSGTSESPASAGPDPESEPDDAHSEDQVAAFDARRRRCPVDHDEHLGWAVLRHAEVLEVLHDHETFSNHVSTHLTVPNGMDPPEHTPHRAINERYFTPERMAALEPVCRRIAAELVDALPRDVDVEVMEAFARTYALRVQTAFMGWPESLHEPLRAWTLANHRATLSRDREATAAVALQFDGYIRELLDARRAAQPRGRHVAVDVTTELLGETVDGRPLTDEEIVSVIRNWTVGELSTIAASVGILLHLLASRPQEQRRLRADRALLPAAVDEMLRVHPPLVANRRRATRDVTLGGQPVAAGDRVTVVWASANRDEAVFGDPDEVRLDRDPADNLLYGAGIHVCPGAPLARLELRVVLEEVLARTAEITLGAGTPPQRATYPASGFSAVELRFR